MPVAFTDLFNEALDDLAASLNTITGLQVVTDPRNLVPPCAFIDAPTFTVYSNNVVEMTFPIRIITLGPGNLDAQRSLLNLASKVITKNWRNRRAPNCCSNRRQRTTRLRFDHNPTNPSNP